MGVIIFHQIFFDDHNRLDIFADSFRPSECSGLEDELNQASSHLAEGISRLFEDWILSVDFNLVKKKELLDIDVRAKFLNFNYTNTLEEVYKIEGNRITYLHNNAKGFNDELIFGHGLGDEHMPNEEELDEDGDSNRTMFSDSIAASRGLFHSLRKETNTVISRHQAFFRGLSGVDEIIVLGHSFGLVDLPYFKEIHEHIPEASWKISYYTEKDGCDIKAAITECNIHEVAVELITMENLKRG